MVDEDSLNELLKPLNLTAVHRTSLRLYYERPVYYERQALKWYIASKSNVDVPIKCMFDSIGWIHVYAYTLEELIECVLSKAIFFDVEQYTGNDEPVKNPYFECKSLEEMFVKRDLMYA